MKIDVFDKNGKSVEKIEIAKDLFGRTGSGEDILQYLRVFYANQRQGTSSTKTRGEVSGGGKKPWKQKGTGRARVGSSRNPLWRKGGISHGPRPKDWSLKISKKVKRGALISALSHKASADKIRILDQLELKEKKTRKVRDILQNLKISNRTIFVYGTVNENLSKSASNIKGFQIVGADSVNAFDILSSDYLLFSKDGLLSLERKLNENK